LGSLRLEVTTPSGFTFKDIKTEQDVDLMNRILNEAKSTAPVENSPIVAAPVSKPTMKTTDFLSVVKGYLEERKFSNVEKTLLEKESVYKTFAELFGNPNFNFITTENAITYKNRLLGQNFSASRINKIISILKDLFSYGINNRHYFAANPFENIAIKSNAKKKSRSYEQFTQEELGRIFQKDVYLKEMKKPDYFWLPFLAMYSGARLEELASLTFEQIKQENSIWIFDIKKAKTENSVRKIPIHKRILESDFFNYLEKADKTNGQIFPLLKDGKNGFSKNTSRKFGEYLDLPEINVTSSQKVFHSFRSNYINAMTNIGCHPAILMSLVGHYEQSKIDFSSPHFQNYQEKKPMDILKDWNDRLVYPIDLWF
jgi:integrase